MPDLSWAARGDWQSAWDGAVALVGTDLRPGYEELGADPLERSVIRRFLEPLEFDCPLHYDTETARRYGYPDVIAPYSGFPAWLWPALWEPGDPPYYTSDERDHLPDFKVFPFPEIGPDTNGKVVTDMETEFFHPFVLGDRLRKVGARLLSCHPKEGRVGRGAYLTFESDILGRDNRVLAQTRTTLYAYVPRADIAKMAEEANNA
jgi:hypothetical protein